LAVIAELAVVRAASTLVEDVERLLLSFTFAVIAAFCVARAVSVFVEDVAKFAELVFTADRAVSTLAEDVES
jgi:hypothetical protein